MITSWLSGSGGLLSEVETCKAKLERTVARLWTWQEASGWKLSMSLSEWVSMGLNTVSIELDSGGSWAGRHDRGVGHVKKAGREWMNSQQSDRVLCRSHGGGGRRWEAAVMTASLAIIHEARKKRPRQVSTVKYANLFLYLFIPVFICNDEWMQVEINWNEMKRKSKLLMEL